MRATDRSTVAVTIAVLLASLTIRPLTTDGQYLVISWLLVLSLGVITALLRRARLGPTAVFAIQVVVLGLGLGLLTVSMADPTATSWYGGLGELWQSGINHMQTQTSPMEPNDGVTLIFVTAVGIVMVLTDLLVGGVGRPGWAFAPPTALYLVPALGLAQDASILSFGLVAVGYLAILIADGLNSNARWTRGLSLDSSETMGAAAPVVWRAAGYLAVPALVLTVIASLMIPTISVSGIGFGRGPGGNGPLQLGDPTLDLRRNLTQAAERPVIKYRSVAGSNRQTGTYLRLTTLPQFGNAGWSPVQIQVTPGDRLGQIPGVTTEPGPRRQTSITVTDGFESEYLPSPYAPRSFNADGAWGFDPGALSILAMGSEDVRRRQVAGLSYSVESVDIMPTSEQLSLAAAGTPQDSAITTAIPDDLPQSLRDLTGDVTSDATSAFERATAIQAYLRSDIFRYDTRPLPGSGYQALENFLLRDRRGYCEQFAGAMAMMARVAGIPSRVTIGFLPGDRNSDGTYTVTNHKMHAWPELYFSGYGWIRFEPTPASQAGSVPDWSIPPSRGDDPSEPTDVPSESSTLGPDEPSAGPSAGPSEGPVDDPQAGADPWQTVAGIGIGLVVLLILAAPATLRIRRRTSRLNPHQDDLERVEGAWREIRDTVVDLGGRWPEGSPRKIGVAVSEQLDRPQADGMTGVAILVERSRYARSAPDEQLDELPEIARTVRAGLAEPQSRWRRFLAFWLPRSLFRRP